MIKIVNYIIYIIVYVLYDDELVKHDLKRPLVANNEVLMAVKSA